MSERATLGRGITIQAMTTAADLALAAIGAMRDIGKIGSLDRITELRKTLDDLEVAMVAAARLDEGATWDEMAEELGVKRQSLHYRLHRQIEAIVSRAQAAMDSDPRRYWGNLRSGWTNRLSLLRERSNDLAKIQVFGASARLVGARSDVKQRP